MVRRSAELVDRGLRHLRDVSRVILEENRLDRSGHPLSKPDFEDLRLLFEPEAKRRDQKLDWIIEASDDALKHLPSTPVRQIALNLLLNASSAAPVGGAVALEVRESDTGVRLSVRDNGPGLSETARARLMSEGPIEPGGGVGLRLVRDLVAGLGGRIDYVRTENETEIVVNLVNRTVAQC